MVGWWFSEIFLNTFHNTVILLSFTIASVTAICHGSKHTVGLYQCTTVERTQSNACAGIFRYNSAAFKQSGMCNIHHCIITCRTVFFAVLSAPTWFVHHHFPHSLQCTHHISRLSIYTPSIPIFLSNFIRPFHFPFPFVVLVIKQSLPLKRTDDDF